MKKKNPKILIYILAAVVILNLTHTDPAKKSADWNSFEGAGENGRRGRGQEKRWVMIDKTSNEAEKKPPRVDTEKKCFQTFRVGYCLHFPRERERTGRRRAVVDAEVVVARGDARGEPVDVPARGRSAGR